MVASCDCCCLEVWFPPVAWKRALIVALHKKGDRAVPGNWRGISLLSIPGKVYAMLIMRRLRDQIDGQLHEAQCGFRPHRGTTDAMFTLRQLVDMCRAGNSPLCAAFIDLAKAYDSVTRAALWSVLALFNVHPKIVALLEDLHTGTTAALRMDGDIGPSFAVDSGVRQGCVIAPMLFNVYMDYMLQQALSRMQSEFGEDCGVGVFVQECLQSLAAILYADDMVLVSHCPAQLTRMLVILDEVACGMGLSINADKTKILLFDKSGALQQHFAAHPVVLSGGRVQVVDRFKYLGSWLCSSGTLDDEVGCRKARVYAAMSALDGVWRNRHLNLACKVAAYKCFVLPHFMYGAESWNATSQHEHMLEVVQNNCMRRLLQVTLRDRHSVDHMRRVCGLQSIQLLLAKCRLRWAGHVARMPASRLPHAVLFGKLRAPAAPRAGRPPMSFKQALARGAEACGICKQPNVEFVHTISGLAQDKGSYRALLAGLSLLPSRQTRAASVHHMATRSRAAGTGS